MLQLRPIAWGQNHPVDALGAPVQYVVDGTPVDMHISIAQFGDAWKVAQFTDRALRVHRRFVPMEILAPTLDLHPVPHTMVYRTQVHGPDPEQAPTMWLDARDLDAQREMQRRYFLRAAEMKPRVYWRLTDNWLELSVRFIAEDRGIRELKDTMSREILAGLDAAGIGLASTTFEIVGLPPLRIQGAGVAAALDGGNSDSRRNGA